ncbi:MAG: cupin domain-containing protein [Gammaproteobacteria bacterium]|nr:cupin domain-containing protein [Gammaproteobacteria bacterium]NNJ94500.1 cupin domain-containing protein [Halobacteria archaeon]
MEIVIEHKLKRSQLDALGVFDWPVWEKEVSRFDWTYDTQETCYLIAGSVTVTPEGGAPVNITTGDYVIFPAGMSCVWDISEPVSKHYRFG